MSTAVRERPIVLSAEEVWAVLEGRQTQIRRAVKPQPPELDSDFEWAISVDDDGRWQFVCEKEHPPGVDHPGGIERHLWRSLECPFGRPGDRLWMRSSFEVRYVPEFDETHWTAPGLWVATRGRAGLRDGRHSPLHMPYWLSVEQWPVLEITDVRVEPDEQWVWVIEFRRIAI